MANCKDCLHIDVCRGIYLAITSGKINSYEEFLEKCEKEHFEQQDIFPCYCFFYKNRFRFIELPCKVGDVVYRICPINDCGDCRRCPWECDDCYDIGFVNDNANSIRRGKANDYNWILKRAQYFGKIYFATKEEAERVLKGRENNAE